MSCNVHKQWTKERHFAEEIAVPDDGPFHDHEILKYSFDLDWIPRLFSNLVNWCRIKRWGESKTVRWSGIALLVTPLVARVILHWPFFGTRWALSMPVNLALLYLAGICFLVGQMLYFAACPKLVRLFDSAAQVNALHPGSRFLEEWISHVIMSLPAGTLRPFVRKLSDNLPIGGGYPYLRLIAGREVLTTKNNRLRASEILRDSLRANQNDPIVIANAFDITSYAAAKLRPTVALLTIILFMTGFGATAGVIIHNSIMVLRSILR